MMFRRLAVLAGSIGLALMLSGCGSLSGMWDGKSDFPEQAYKTGQVFHGVQVAANAYLEVVDPKLEVYEKVNSTMHTGDTMVTEMLACAATLVEIEETDQPPAEAAALGLTADEAVDAQEDACQDLMSRALMAMNSLAELIGAKPSTP